MRKLKRKLKLWWLNRRWVIQSVYNTKDFIKAGDYLDLEKDVKRMYHKAKREEDKNEILRCEGRLEIVNWIKNEEEEK